LLQVEQNFGVFLDLSVQFWVELSQVFHVNHCFEFFESQ